MSRRGWPRALLCQDGGVRPVLIAVVAAVVATPSLSPATLNAFDRYVVLTEQRLAAEREGRSPFLWTDRQPDRDRARILDRLRRGEVVVDALETRDGGKGVAVPDGLIHHWVATVLLPGVPAGRGVAFVRDYEAYPRVFVPLITRAVVRERGASRDVVALRTSVKKIISVVVDADYVMQYGDLGPGRAWTSNVATNIHQIMDAGEPGERQVPTEETSGYFWRYRMYCAFEERPEGTYDQCESLTLTRRPPALLSWLVGRTVKGIPRDSLVLMMTAARATLVK